MTTLKKPSRVSQVKPHRRFGLRSIQALDMHSPNAHAYTLLRISEFHLFYSFLNKEHNCLSAMYVLYLCLNAFSILQKAEICC